MAHKTRIDGLWTGEFATTEGSFGGGVVFVADGKIYGGDNGYFFYGSVDVEMGTETPTIHAVVDVEPFIKGFESLFKVKDRSYKLTLVGKFAGEGVVVGYGSSPDFPGSRLSMRLTLRRTI